VKATFLLKCLLDFTEESILLLENVTEIPSLSRPSKSVLKAIALENKLVTGGVILDRSVSVVLRIGVIR
jgi:hypothetical protein